MSAAKKQKEAQEVASLTPFKAKDFVGCQFARAHMIGGANPLESAVTAPWKKKPKKKK